MMFTTVRTRWSFLVNQLMTCVIAYTVDANRVYIRYTTTLVIRSHMVWYLMMDIRKHIYYI